MKGNANAKGKNTTNRILLLEARRRMPIREIILESYWVHRDWGGVSRDLSIGRTTLRDWRIRASIDEKTVKRYVASRMRETA